MGKSLFQTSNLGNIFNFNIKSDEKKNAEDEDDEPLKEDVKEGIQSNKQFEKVFQKLVEKLKILKGISAVDKQPSKKDNGFLSIEKFLGADSGQNAHYLVFRNFMGQTLFSALINPKVAKIKEINTKEHRYKVKVAVACKDPQTKQYA